MSDVSTIAVVLGADYAATIGAGTFLLHKFLPRARENAAAAPEARQAASPEPAAIIPALTPLRPQQEDYEAKLREFAIHLGTGKSVPEAGALVGVRPRTAREYAAELRRRAA